MKQFVAEYRIRIVSDHQKKVVTKQIIRDKLEDPLAALCRDGSLESFTLEEVELNIISSVNEQSHK